MSDSAARYSVGIEDLEAEHSKQFALIDEIEQRLAAGDAVRARDAMQRLYAYTEAHFGSEQVLMRQHSHPDYDAHLREHGELLAALRRMIDDGSTSPATLRQWLTSHIHHADRAFADHITRSPLRPE